MRQLLLPFAVFIAPILFTISMATVAAQQTTPAPEAKPTPTESPKVASADRLAGAKNLFIKKTGGSEIPYNVINSGFEGWGRYVLVDTADKADLIMEISAPSDDSGTRVTTKVDRETGQPGGYSSSKDLSSDPIKVTVYDAKSKRPLWSATDKPKFAMKQKARENNLVESAQRLFSKFHDRVEKKLP